VNSKIKPLVSIVIPCYNAARWIGEAIESCINQTYPNIEVIVVDDGSSDGSRDVILGYAERFKEKMRTFNQENKGSNAARNAGIRASQGFYLLFLDGDDLLLPDAVENLIQSILQNGTDAALGDWINFSDDASLPEQRLSARPYYPKDPVATIFRDPAIISTFLSKKMPLEWNEELKIHQVLDYFFHFFLQGNSLSYVPEVVTRIRQHSSPERISIKHHLFEPYRKGKIMVTYKQNLEANGKLTLCRQEALDQSILSNAYQLFRKGQKSEGLELINSNDWGQISNYDWYKPWGISGFVKTLSPGRGAFIFYLIQKCLGRI